MNNRIQLVLAVVSVMLALSACKTAPTSESRRQELITAADQGLAEMRNADQSLESFLSTAHGYAMFPAVGSGGFIVGGGWGRAAVYEQGNFIGFADMTKANIGLTAGGQRFRQLIVFQDQASLDRFRRNQLTFDANATAVALTSGAAATAAYRNGVAIFVQPIGGLMVSANLGGQQFRFQPDTTTQ
jgi:lipid-binding SYLF domain-containing protein